MAVIKHKVFYSFHFDNDVFRVQQIRNMGVVEGDEPVTPNAWETLRKTPSGVENWINENIAKASCVIVLVGSETYTRPWVRHEIARAWNEGKGLLGIYIHNLSCPRQTKSIGYGTCSQGENPFEKTKLTNGRPLSHFVQCYNPTATEAYNEIQNNLQSWVETAIANRA